MTQEVKKEKDCSQVKQDGRREADSPAVAAFSLGILALAIPVIGIVLGALAAVLGGIARRRAVRAGPPYPGYLKLASYGTLFGMCAIVLNIVLAIVVVVYQALKGS